MDAGFLSVSGGGTRAEGVKRESAKPESEKLRGAARRHDAVELLAGLVVLALLAGLIVAAVISNGRKSDAGYRLTAQFNHIDGLDIGSDVRIAGVAVGEVLSETVDPKSFQAVVTMSMRPDIKLPDDSSVVVTSDSLLGGKYLAVSPGGDTQVLSPGGRIQQTQGSISLEQLLSKFIFTVSNAVGKPPAAAGTAHAAPGKPPPEQP